MDRDRPKNFELTGAADGLDRRPIARRLATALVSDPVQDGLVCSIEGPWGSGKSTVLSHLRGELNEDPTNPVVVEFNPWLVGAVSSLIEEFFSEVSRRLGESVPNNSESQALAEAVRDYGMATATAAGLVVVDAGTTMAAVIQLVAARLRARKRRRELGLAARKHKVVKLLKKFQRPIVVLIDDLDRSPPKEVYSMLRFVAAVSELGFIRYLLAIDRASVVSALENEHVSDGNAFLEKIVQFPMVLPSLLGSQKAKLVDSLLSRFEQSPGTFLGDEDRLSTLYHFAIEDLIRTPRDIVRIFNQLESTNKFLEADVRFSDRFALAAIQICAPSVYHCIAEHPEAYVGFDSYQVRELATRDVAISEGETLREAALSQVALSRRAHVGSLLRRLFPALDQAELPRVHEGLIGHPLILKVATTGNMLRDQVSLRSVREFMSNGSLQGASTEVLSTPSHVSSFLERLQHWPDGEFEFENAIEGIETLMRLLETAAAQAEEDRLKGQVLSLTPSDRVAKFIVRVLQKLEGADRQTFVKAVFSEPRYLRVTTEVVADLKAKATNATQTRTDSDQWEECVELMQRIWKDVALEALQTFEGLSELSGSSIIYVLRALAPEDTKRIVAAALNDEKLVDSLFLVLGPNRADSNNGRYTRLEDELLSSFGDPSKIRETAKGRLACGENLNPILQSVLRSIGEDTALYTDGTARREW